MAFRKLETFFGADEIERYMRAERERLGIDPAEGSA
jgi:hypothetical protein